VSISHLVSAAVLILATTAGATPPGSSTSRHHDRTIMLSDCYTIAIVVAGRPESVTICHLPPPPPI